MYENKDKVYIHVNEMADFLQKKYRNYRDKKRSPFRAVVRRAYDEITESFARKSNSSDWQEDEDEDDNIDVEACLWTFHYFSVILREVASKLFKLTRFLILVRSTG